MERIKNFKSGELMDEVNICKHLDTEIFNKYEIY